MGSYQFVSVERTEHVATITIQRADKLNALNAQVIAELSAAFAEVTSTSARVAILTGVGKAFVAGADIAEMATMTPVEAKVFSDAGHRLCLQIEESHIPVIAAVNGFALGGGCELALACDFIYAADSAKFGQPEVNLGVIPGFGGTQRLVRRVGAARARELVYTGDVIAADQALAYGLANAVFPGVDLLAKVKDVATKIASKGPLAVAQSKRIMLRGETLDLGAACELEAQGFARLFGSEDQKLGMRAFLEKTKAIFQGR